MGVNRTSSLVGTVGSAHVQATQTAARITPATPSFQEVMGTSADVLMRGAVGAIRALPAAPLVAASVRPMAPGALGVPGVAAAGAAAEGAGALGATGGGAGVGVEAALAHSQDMNLYFIELQERLASENRAFTTYSNVLKARHDTVKNAISNIR